MMNHLLENDIMLEYNYHSAAEYVNYPWDYHPADPPDSQYILSISQLYADLADLTAINGYDWYQITGSLQDYTIGTSGALATTIETLEPAGSSAIDQICYNNRDALMELCLRAGWGIEGVVKDSIAGSPVSARIEFINPERICIYNDPVLGDFHKMIAAGIYDLRVCANGYAPKSVNNITVPPSGSVWIGDILLRPDSSYFYAHRAVLNRYVNHAQQSNKTRPRAVLGAEDNIFYSLGQGGYVVLDMGEHTPIMNNPGDDFTVFEGDDGIAEGYEVFVSNNWNGPWLSCGTATGTSNFDIEPTGLSQVRYIRVVDDGSSSSGPYAGFDLDAIKITPPISIVESKYVDLSLRAQFGVLAPNPFSSAVRIPYQVARSGVVKLGVYDVSGRLVRSLASAVHQPGYYQVIWPGVDDQGRKAPAGVYFVRLETGDYTATEKVILVK